MIIFSAFGAGIFGLLSVVQTVCLVQERFEGPILTGSVVYILFAMFLFFLVTSAKDRG